MAKIFPLPEGLFTVGHDKQLVPFTAGVDQLNERPVGSLLVEIQPFLVVTQMDVLVFDTGLGLQDAQHVPVIHINLALHGYRPEQVTKVLLSHLHKDHAGGMTYIASDGILRTTFPNAQYYIYRAEAEYALQKGLPSYNSAEIESMLSTPQIHWLDGESGSIDGYITYTHSGAHCPQHIVFLLDDGTDKVFFGGDEAPQLKQLKMRYIAKYDYDGKKALALRGQYARHGKAEGWKFMFYHDAKNPVAILE